MGPDFTILGIQFDPQLNMHNTISHVVTNCGWKLRTLLRTQRFHTDRELITLFKSHILTYIEYRTPAIYHCTNTSLLPLNRILPLFLRSISITLLEALHHFNLAPLPTRRDIAILGVIHRATLRQGHHALHTFFRRDNDNHVRPNLRSTYHRHYNHLHDPLTNSTNTHDFYRRSPMGAIRIYNTLPAAVVEAPTTQTFQRRLQALVKYASIRTEDWPALYSTRLPTLHHPLATMPRTDRMDAMLRGIC